MYNATFLNLLSKKRREDTLTRAMHIDLYTPFPIVGGGRTGLTQQVLKARKFPIRAGYIQAKGWNSGKQMQCVCVDGEDQW